MRSFDNVGRNTHYRHETPEAAIAKKIRKRDLNSIANAVAERIGYFSDKPPEDMNIPENVDPLYYLTLMKTCQIALREPLEEIKHKCTKCGEEDTFKLPSRDLERNQIAMLKTLIDKMFPNLHSVDANVNIAASINIAGEEMAKIIKCYVPETKQAECLSRIFLMLDSLGGPQAS